MKFLKLFKKETKNIAKSTIQKLDKSQLEKVLGGGDGDLTRVPPSIRGVVIDKK